MIIENEKISMRSDGSLVGTFTAVSQKGRKLYVLVAENIHKKGCYFIENDKSKVIHEVFDLSDFTTAWYVAKNYVLNKNKRPPIETTYKINKGKKFLSIQAKKKTGGRYDLLVQELDDKGAILWLTKKRFYRGQEVTGGDKTILYNGFHSFSEAVRYGKNYLLNLIGK